MKAQFGGKAGGAQHTDRVFPEAGLRVANQVDDLLFDIIQAADKVMQSEVGDVVVQRVDGEIPPQGIFLDTAPGVVAQDQAGFLVGVMLVPVRVVLAIHGTEGGDFDDLAAKTHMHDLETTTDDAAALEQAIHLFRRGIGGYVEILGLTTAENVPQATAHQIGFKAGLVQAIEHIQCSARHLFAGDGMLVAGNDSRFERSAVFWGTLLKPVSHTFQELAGHASVLASRCAIKRR